MNGTTNNDEQIRPKTSGWREQMVEARRQHILEAAVQVFADKGYHRSTVKEIAAAAGIAEGTIYNYFGGKEDLLKAMLDSFVFSSLRRVMDQAGEEGTAAFLKAIIKDRIDFMRANKQVFLAVFPEVMSNLELRRQVFEGQVFPFMQDAEEFIAQGIRDGELKDVSIQTVASLIIGVLVGTVFSELAAGADAADPARDDELADNLADVVLYGLAASPEAV